MGLEYKINVLEALKAKGYNPIRLRREKLLPESTIQKLRHGQAISWSSIEQICSMLNCQPNYFLIYKSVPGQAGITAAQDDEEA